MMARGPHSCKALVEEMIDGVTPVINAAMAKTDDAATQNAAVSALGTAIAVATLRSVSDRDAAIGIAMRLIASFADECSDVIKEVWGDREQPQ